LVSGAYLPENITHGRWTKFLAIIITPFETELGSLGTNADPDTFVPPL
jgi:hypothetical protein